MYSPLESTLANFRGKEDSLNSILAASITGVLYKSTGERVTFIPPLVHSFLLLSWFSTYGIGWNSRLWCNRCLHSCHSFAWKRKTAVQLTTHYFMYNRLYLRSTYSTTLILIIVVVVIIMIMSSHEMVLCEWIVLWHTTRCAL